MTSDVFDGASARGAIALGVAILVLTSVALALQPTVSQLPVASFVDRFNLLLLGGALGFGLPGAYTAYRRPGNRVGWLAGGIGIASALALLAQQYGIIGVHHRPDLPAAGWAIWMANWIWAPAYWLIPSLLLLVFPTGRLPSSRWRPAAWAAWGAVTLSTVGWALDPASDGDTLIAPPGFHFPAPSSTTTAHLMLSAGAVVGLGASAAGVASLLHRYRRAAGVERLQISWVLVGGLATVVLLITTFAVDRWAIGLAMVPLPLGMSIAVVQHRLWDIELVLNRSLLYAILTAGIAGLYFLCVVALGDALGTTTGAPLLATAVVALAVHPAHAKVRRWANHVVYGDRDDPAAALRRLGNRLDGIGTPDEVLAGAAQSVARALRAGYVAIEVDGSTAAAVGVATQQASQVPLVYAGEIIGTLVIGLPRMGRLGRPERRLVDDLAPHLGVVVHAYQLSGELALSRDRLIAARSDERRRLQRDLHDGLGPTLAALALQIDRSRRLLSTDPPRAASLLDDLSQRIRDTVGTVRAVVEDIRPPDLDALGLTGALETLARRLETSDLKITVRRNDTSTPLPAPVELAVYRIASEAMTNTSRHASASSCEVSVHVMAGRLELSITDDGVGVPADREPGTGFRSMCERADELGGTCMIEPLVPRGTRVAVCIPLPGGQS